MQSFWLPSALLHQIVCFIHQTQTGIGIGIANMRVADFKALEKVQDTCLRMIFGGHRAASTMVFRHMTNLPLMRQRVPILVTHSACVHNSSRRWPC
ncbi:uncharacterized protein ATC70_008055 [Mucor velutinosus]|uniref:Uncharacterized protein n=1 Tax=Mucor velutinosus TaxID=708070 RepID=A0AAN7HVE0_9FUNG|nr:hypothetical protein ATC70_008055 [Mucor velutinosus]